MSASIADSADKNPVPADSSTPDSSTTDSSTPDSSTTDNATDNTEELDTMTVTTDDKQANAALIVKGEAESESALNVRPSYLGNRPVEPSTSKIIETFSAVGGSRPIFASDIEIADTIQASGIRPISASTLVISEQYSVMGGNRPVASNEIDDVSLLMGYLD
jgi:hypothetical protein